MAPRPMNRALLLKFALMLAVVQCAVGRSIEELYKVEVVGRDTAQAALAAEDGTNHVNGGKSSGESDEDGSGEDDDELSRTGLASIILGIVIVGGVLSTLIIICLCGCCCFAKKPTPITNTGRRNSPVIVTSVIPPLSKVTPDTTKAEEAARVITAPPPSAPVLPENDAPPEYNAVMFSTKGQAPIIGTFTLNAYKK